MKFLVLPRSGRPLLASLTLAAAALLTPTLWAQDAKLAESTELAIAGNGRNDIAGGKESPVQSTATPLSGMDIAGPVMAGASDANSTVFFHGALNKISDTIDSKLAEYVKANDASMLLDPKMLTLGTDSFVRLYFVGEGAGYHNSLGFNTTGGLFKGADSQILFPDASSPVSSYYTEGQYKIERTGYEPLLPGDFVNLGAYKAGTQLDFFLVSDGANGGSSVFSTEQSYNPDGINHVVAMYSKFGNSTYLLLGFEDLWDGGDRDFNDVIVALEISPLKIKGGDGTGGSAGGPVTAAPEPSLWAVMGGLLGVTMWVKRRKDSSPVSNQDAL